jgi:hypothetical protein
VAHHVRLELECLEDRVVLSTSIVVPERPSIVTTEPGDRRIFVRDRLPDGFLGEQTAAIVRGVNWSPHSRGADPADLHLEFERWYQTDIPLMAEMGVNTVRVYHDFGTGPVAMDILDTFYRHGIRVIVLVDSPRQGVVADLQNVEDVVTAYKDHPAIFAWGVGNEWDLNNTGNGFYFGTFPSLLESANFVEQAARRVKAIDTNHPVITFMADPHIPGVHPLSPEEFPFVNGRPYTSEIVTTIVPSVDVWGFNVYRGSSFQDVFQMWGSISTEPMLIGEFGADTFDHGIQNVNETLQADFDATLWAEVFFQLSAQRVDGVAAGGFVFEFNDEWWKNGNPAVHDISAEMNPGQPDGFNDEEYFGVVDIDRNPREAHATFQEMYVCGPLPIELNAMPLLEATSQSGGNSAEFSIDDRIVYRRAGFGGGGRGINVAILDTATGIRMQEVRHFDTFLTTPGGQHTAFADLANYLAGLPDGSVLLLSVADEAGFINSATGNPWPDPFVEQGYQALEALGGTQIRQVGFRGGWTMIVVKGQAPLAEAFSGALEPVSVQAQVPLTLNPDSGRRERVPTTTTLTSSPNPSFLGQEVTFTAVLSPSSLAGDIPTGSVSFLIGTQLLGTAPVDDMGRATFTTSALPLGTIEITARYNGDFCFQGSDAVLRQEVLRPEPDTVGMYDPTGFTDPLYLGWYLRSANNSGSADAGQFVYGARNWTGLVGDWNGDGLDTIGVVDTTGADPRGAVWYLRNSNSPGAPDISPFVYGLPGWIPVAGDWDGDGVDGIGIYDPSTSTWYLRNQPGSAGPADVVIFFGVPGWIPVVGDWDGDGIDTIGMVDPTTFTWYQAAENVQGTTPTVFAYGGVGWRAVVGDWDGDGTSTVGVVDPSGQWYLRNSNSPGAPDLGPFAYGLGSWVPVAGRFTAPSESLRTASSESEANRESGTDGLDALFSAGL